MRIYRLCKERYSASVLSGEGGLRADGRWHIQGHPIVYCASSDALAVLELRVHVGHFLPRDQYVMHEFELAETMIERLNLDLLSKGWDSVPHSLLSQSIGETWLEQRRLPALLVPSLHSRTDFNILLNPLHERHAEVTLHNKWIYNFDPRMFA